MIGNLYKIASNAIGGSVGTDIIFYKKFLGNVTGKGFVVVPSYAEPVQISGSFQVVSSSLYSQRGLDINKHYRILYTDTEITEIDTNTSSDRIVYGNDTYQVLDKEDWYVYNGWVGVLCVRL
jgi:hypothetical protein